MQRYPFRLEWVMNQPFEIDRFQPLFFIVDSFEDLYQQIDELENWLHQGKLDNISPGNPLLTRKDLKDFLKRMHA